MLVRFLALLPLALPLCAVDVVKAFGYEWEVPDATHWKVETVDGQEVLRQVTNPTKDPAPRRPMHQAVARTKPFSKVTIECEMQRVGKSMIVLYAWRDAAHYDYVHFSSDSAEKVIVHNGVFHVYGGERVRISKAVGPGTLPTTEWIKVKVVHDGKTGRAYAEVDGKRNPSLDAVDVSLTEGRVGLGSFFETGAFRKVVIKGE
jgi:hypothetical protein